MGPDFDGRLAAAYDVIALWRTPEGPARMAAEAESIEMVVTSAFKGCDDALMARLPRLKAVCSFGVGTDSIDLAAAARRGVVVSNTPEVLDDCVADLGFALVLDVARRISESDRYLRAGGWEKTPFPLAARVSGKKLGIVGLGRIGKVVARRASGFDMTIGYHNRKPDPAVGYAYLPSVVDLARWADILILTCPGGAATRNLISTAELQALGPQGFLVNVSRGSVVDEPALISALEKGLIAGAGLDVFADEPHVPDALKALDNVVLTPHVASATRETRRAMHDLTLANVAAFFASGRLVTPVG
ncbi:2-hydroxyacid dehydrogenase [Siculibacillus lacustris]|uniref:2-hydroxyacid dehydrogenase n=2 Tax=Siculibacillus lacustris TaxID=1549641 RepID=A0A4Q9VFR3_9HYPH|nr:2-hydroxyacid dehydrogenase [Siculibacillus lacustris]